MEWVGRQRFWEPGESVSRRREGPLDRLTQGSEKMTVMASLDLAIRGISRRERNQTVGGWG